MKSLFCRNNIICLLSIILLISGNVKGQVPDNPYDLFPGGIGDGHSVDKLAYKTLNGDEPEIGLPVVSDFELCGGGILTLSATPGNNSTTVYWYESLNSTDPLATTTDFEVDLSASAKFWVASVNEVTGQKSARVSSVVKVHYADAGPDQFISELVFNPGLSANNPTGEGVWSLKTGEGIFEDANDPNTLVNGIGYGLNTYTWTLLGCDSGFSSDDVSLFYLSYKYPGGIGDGHSLNEQSYKTLNGDEPEIGLPVVSDFELCGGGIATLSATPGNNATTVYWYESLNSSDPLATTTDFEVNLTTTTKFWVASVNETTGLKSTKVSTFVYVHYANAGPDQFISEIVFSPRLSANNPTGEGIWSLKTGDGLFEDANDPNTLVNYIGYGLNTYTWTLLGCNAGFSSDDVNLYFLDYKYPGGIGDGFGSNDVKQSYLGGLPCGPPDVITKDIIVALDENGFAQITAQDIDNGTNSDCNIVSMELSKSVFNCSDLGNNIVTLTVTDEFGAFALGNATVSVEDNHAPVPNITELPALSGECVVEVLEFPAATDNCSGNVIATTSDPLLFETQGTFYVNWLFDDENGNQTIQTQQIVVKDQTPPSAVCQDISVQLDELNEASVSVLDVEGDSYDNCGIASSEILSGQTFYSCLDAGQEFEVVVKVTDINGLSGTCTSKVNVLDDLNPCNQPPVAACKNITVGTGTNCTALINAEQVNNGSYDPDLDELSFTLDNYGPFSVGEHTVTLSVTDPSGESDQCQATVTVKDNNPPTVLSQNITVFLDETGVAAIQPEDVDNNSYDDCGIASMTVAPNTFACSDVDNPVTVTLTITDANGNSASNTAVVTVIDNIAPTVLTQNITVYLDETGAASIQPEDADNNSHDACGIASMTVVPNTFACSDVDNPVTVTLTVTDVNGNSASNTAVVTVIDNINPEINCVANDSRYADPYQTYYTINSTEFDATAADACGVASLTYFCATASEPSGTSLANVKLFGIKQHSITWTTIDVNENVSTCKTFVTVGNRPTTLTYTGDLYVQYSDQTMLSATLLDVEGKPVAGKTITFTIGTQTTTATTNDNGEAIAALTINQDPGSYIVESSFAGEDYLSSSDSEPFTINPEDACWTYTGPVISTVNAAGEVTLLLSATIFESDLYSHGDISTADVLLVIKDENNSPITSLICPVTLDPNNTSIGYISHEHQFTGVGDDAEDFSIFLEIGGNYNNDYCEEIGSLHLYKPDGEFITGGGFLVTSDSHGTFAADAGTKTNFGFHIKWNKTLKNLQGKMNIIFRRTEYDGLSHIYQIKTTATRSLGIEQNPDGDCTFAEFTSKANLTDLTTGNNWGGLELRVITNDCGEPGDNDAVGITLWENNTLLYSSNWDGIQTIEQSLDGGNLVVHTKAQKAAEIVNDVEPELQYVDLKVYPNPFNEKLTFEFVSPVTIEARIELYDEAGRMVSTVFEAMVEKDVIYHAEFKPKTVISAVYYYRLILGKQIYNGKVIYKKE